jgi:hypothetical protein
MKFFKKNSLTNPVGTKYITKMIYEKQLIMKVEYECRQ